MLLQLFEKQFIERRRCHIDAHARNIAWRPKERNKNARQPKLPGALIKFVTRDSLQSDSEDPLHHLTYLTNHLFNHPSHIIRARTCRAAAARPVRVEEFASRF